MTDFPAGDITANGVTVPITVNDRGSWQAEYAGKNLSYETRDRLEASLKRLTKSAAVQVEVSIVSVEKHLGGTRFVRGTLTGIHGRNGNVLVTWHHGGRRGDTKEQISYTYGSANGRYFGGDVTDKQLQEYADLVEAERTAREAVQEAERRYMIKDVKKTVQSVIDSVSGGADTE